MIQAGHHDGNEHPAEKLLEEVLRAGPIIKDKNPCMPVCGYRAEGVIPTESETRHNLPDDQYQGSEEGSVCGPSR